MNIKSANRTHFLSHSFFIVLIFIPAFISCKQNNHIPMKAKETIQIFYDTTSFQPMHHDRRVALFSQKSNRCDYLFLGNSITENGHWEQRLDSLSVVNHGISGDLTFSVLKRLSLTIRHNPKTIFLMIGINDLGKRVPDSIITKNIFKIVKKLNSELPQTKIYLQSILPINRSILGIPEDFNYFEKINAINKKLQANNKHLHYTYLDLHTHFLDSNDNLKQEFTYDGLHLTEAGYTHWLDFLNTNNVFD